MSDRIEKKEFVKQLASRMDTDESVAAEWLDSVCDILYENFKQGKSVTLTGFGGFYVQPKRTTWIFKFNPGQKLKALFGWSSSYKGTY
ncbi:integration host factor subunit alpha [bacterium BMS3Bbin03]|nr:integration host factor subunit alpha [bacterium BMS3Bbin03]